MTQFLNIPRQPSFKERLGSAIGQGLGGGFAGGVEKGAEFGQQMALQKTKEKKDKKDLQGTFGNILDEMKNLKSYVGLTALTPSSWDPTSETAGKRSQINTLRLSLEGLFRDLTLKGQFPKAIYERILKELPEAGDTKQQYLNKIEAIEKILESQDLGSAKSAEKQSSKKGKKVAMQAPNGEKVPMDAANVDEAISRGWKKL